MTQKTAAPDAEDPDDQPVEPGVGHKGPQDLRVHDESDQGAKDQEHQHPKEKDAGRG